MIQLYTVTSFALSALCRLVSLTLDTKTAWQSYAEWLEQYFVAMYIHHGYTEESVAPQCTHVAQRTTNSQGTWWPAKPTLLTLELLELVRNHHKPKPSIVIECFKFHSCV